MYSIRDLSFTTDLTVCSEYLVSGLYGVEDSALTASSHYSKLHVHGPQNARLHFDGHYGSAGGVASAWAAGSSNNQQYIQVQFPRETTVDTIMIQGRKDTQHIQWVKTFYLSYSIDGVTWTSVTSQNQDPMLFTGNSDRNTVVRSSLIPSITAVYIRINPRSWSQHVSLRFDVSGCYKINIRSEFYRVPMLPSVDHDHHLVFESQVQSLPHCGKLCHKGESCFSFTFDINQKMCRGYKPSVTTQYAALSTESTHYFTNKGALNSLGFQSLSSGRTLYKVNELNLNQTDAAAACTQQYLRLIRIKSESEMLSLQNVIAENTILFQAHYQLFVSGVYELPQWKYSNETDVIESALWSPSNPDPSHGHCVMMTQTGLTSVACTESLFSICES